MRTGRAAAADCISAGQQLCQTTLNGHCAHLLSLPSPHPSTLSLRVVNHPAVFKVALFTSALTPWPTGVAGILSALFVIPEDRHIAEHTNKNFIKEVSKEGGWGSGRICKALPSQRHSSVSRDCSRLKKNASVLQTE